MADQRGLARLDPYDLQDRECARLLAHSRSLNANQWRGPSGCEAWTRRDLLGHMVAIEEYFAACLDGSVQALMQRYVEAGASSLDEFNAVGVAATADVPTAALLERWSADNETNRATFRSHNGTDIDSSVGGYPCRLQAFHAAMEYAVHANDLGAPVADVERGQRQRWLAEVGRFALTEVKDDVSVEISEASVEVPVESVEVSRGGVRKHFDLDTFVAGVTGRASPGALTDEDAALLSPGY